MENEKNVFKEASFNYKWVVYLINIALVAVKILPIL